MGSSSLTKDRTRVPSLRVWSLSHWTTREVPGVFDINFYPSNTSKRFKNSSSTKRIININNKRNSFAPPSVATTWNIMFHSFWYLPPYFSMNMCIMLFAYTWPIIILTPNLLNLNIYKALQYIGPVLQCPSSKSWERNPVPNYVFTHHWATLGWAVLESLLGTMSEWSVVCECSGLALITQGLTVTEVTDRYTQLNYNCFRLQI